MTGSASVLFTVAAMWFAAVVTPGPNFLVTTRTALLQSRTRGVQAALGVASGAVVWGFLGGVLRHPRALRRSALAPPRPAPGGSAYLVFLGARMLLASFKRGTIDEVAREPRAGSAFRLGLVTTFANPQSALSTASMFAASLPSNPSLALGFEAVGVMAAISATWYGLVALVLSAAGAAGYFTKLRRWVDRAAGLALVGFGARLAVGGER